jgi:hypothetical protein
MKVKVSEATPPQLDWAVAKCEGLTEDTLHWCLYEGEIVSIGADIPFNPTTNGAQGAPIIEREKIGTVPVFGFTKWQATKMNDGNLPKGYGATHLIAAMCCYVASKLGDEVEIPEEISKCFQS